MRTTVIPAYGRDYRSVKDVTADFDANKDFLICDVASRFDGRYINKEQLSAGDVLAVRYAGNRKQTECKVK